MIHTIHIIRVVLHFFFFTFYFLSILSQAFKGFSLGFIPLVDIKPLIPKHTVNHLLTINITSLYQSYISINPSFFSFKLFYTFKLPFSYPASPSLRLPPLELLRLQKPANKLQYSFFTGRILILLLLDYTELFSGLGSR